MRFNLENALRGKSARRLCGVAEKELRVGFHGIVAMPEMPKVAFDSQRTRQRVLLVCNIFIEQEHSQHIIESVKR